MPFDIDEYALVAIFGMSLVLVLGTGETGHWLGVRAADRP